MLLSKSRKTRAGSLMKSALPLLFIGILGGCTVEPLNASRPATQVGNQSSIQEILSSTSVAPLGTRVGQQVRNNLLFAMNGGQLRPGGRYSVTLDVVSSSRTLAVENSSLSPTSSQIAMTVNYKLIEVSGGKVVAKGARKTLAGYDRTPQSFANERAKRDAENRAAKDVALQVRLALSQAISDL